SCRRQLVGLPFLPPCASRPRSSNADCELCFARSSGLVFARNECPAWIRGADWRENSAASAAVLLVDASAFTGDTADAADRGHSYALLRPKTGADCDVFGCGCARHLSCSLLASCWLLAIISSSLMSAQCGLR